MECNEEKSNAAVTFPVICPVLAICINIPSIIFAFSGFTNAMLFTTNIRIGANN